MKNAKQEKAKRLKMHERSKVQMDLHFPGYPEPWLWHRLTHQGFSSIPRTLPLAMQAIDAQSKGQPAGHTLFCLWARYPDNPLIIIENPAVFASEAGFFGERAVDTWRRRMKKLRELGFIVNKKGPSGDFHYVLLINPNAAVELMKQNGLVQTDLYAKFIDRLGDIGGQKDIDAIRAHWSSILAQNAHEGAPPSGEAPKAAVIPLPPTEEQAEGVEGMSNGEQSQATNGA